MVTIKEGKTAPFSLPVQIVILKWYLQASPTKVAILQIAAAVAGKSNFLLIEARRVA